MNVHGRSLEAILNRMGVAEVEERSPLDSDAFAVAKELRERLERDAAQRVPRGRRVIVCSSCAGDWGIQHSCGPNSSFSDSNRRPTVIWEPTP